MKMGYFTSLRLRKDFFFLHRKGTMLKTDDLSIKFVRAQTSKVAFSIKKKLGKSHDRNKIKRQLRELIRKSTAKPVHFLIIVQRAVISYPFDRLSNDFIQLFEKM